MTPKEFEELTYKNSREDYGLCPPPTDAQEGLNILINHFLGELWYVTLPLNTEQTNTEAIYEILNKNKKPKSFLKKVLNFPKKFFSLIY